MAFLASSKSISPSPLFPINRKFANCLLSEISSKERNNLFCRALKETKTVSGSLWFPCKPKWPNPSAGTTPPNSSFIVTNLLSRSPERGASLENKLGSSILKISRAPISFFNLWSSRSFTKNTLGPHSRNSFFIDQVPIGV